MRKRGEGGGKRREGQKKREGAEKEWEGGRGDGGRVNGKEGERKKETRRTEHIFVGSHTSVCMYIHDYMYSRLHLEYGVQGDAVGGLMVDTSNSEDGDGGNRVMVFCI